MGKTNKDTLIKCSPKFKKTIKELYNSKDFIDDLVNNFESDTNDIVNQEYIFQNILSKRSKKQIFQGYEQDCFLNSVNTSSFKGKSDKEKELLFKDIYNDYKHQLEISLEKIKGDLISKSAISLYANSKLNKSTDKTSIQKIKDAVHDLFSECSLTNISNPNYFRDQINRYTFNIIGDDKRLLVISLCKTYIDIGNKYEQGDFNDKKIFLERNKEEWLVLAKQCKKNLEGISKALIDTTPKRGRPKEKIYPIHAFKREYQLLSNKIEKYLLNNFKKYLSIGRVGRNKIITIEHYSILLVTINSLKNVIGEEYTVNEKQLKKLLNEKQLKKLLKNKDKNGSKQKQFRLSTPQNIAKHIIAETNSMDFNQFDNLLNKKSTFK